MNVWPIVLASALSSLATAGVCYVVWGKTTTIKIESGILGPNTTEFLEGLASTNMFESRMDANESAAIATLKNISSAQAQVQASGIIDSNKNGAGEYGFFGELSGAIAIRNNESGSVGIERVRPPVLSGAFGNVVGGRVMRSGYLFQMYLPSPDGTAARENTRGGSAGVSVSGNHSEVLWCAYAWPTSVGNSGRRAYFINQAGDVLACRNTRARYNGTTNPPDVNAAYLPGTADVMGSTIAANATGKDGERWILVR